MDGQILCRLLAQNRQNGKSSSKNKRADLGKICNGPSAKFVQCGYRGMYRNDAQTSWNGNVLSQPNLSCSCELSFHQHQQNLEHVS
jgi:hypothetical protein